MDIISNSAICLHTSIDELFLFLFLWFNLGIYLCLCFFTHRYFYGCASAYNCRSISRSFEKVQPCQRFPCCTQMIRNLIPYAVTHTRCLPEIIGDWIWKLWPPLMSNPCTESERITSKHTLILVIAYWRFIVDTDRWLIKSGNHVCGKIWFDK